MSVLSWDEDGERLFETGVDHVVLYPMKDDGSYEEGIAWNGVTGVTESPEGADANDIYADNIKYLSLISKEDWKGTIKAYTYPDAFNECMGHYTKLTSSGTSAIRAFFGQQKRKKFALSWRTRLGNDAVGDSFAYKIHLAWGLSAAPSEMDHATQNDSPEAQEFSWEITSIPPQTAAKIHTNGSSSTSTSDYKSLKACSHVYVASKILTSTGVLVDNSTAIQALETHLYGSEGTATSNTAQIPTLEDMVLHYATGDYPDNLAE